MLIRKVYSLSASKSIFYCSKHGTAKYCLYKMRDVQIPVLLLVLFYLPNIIIFSSLAQAD